MVRFAASVQPAGESSAGVCMSTEVTRAQAAGLADSLRESGWDVEASCGRLEGAEDECDAVVFQEMTLGVVLFTRGAWVMGDLSGGPEDFAAALSRLMHLLEERFGWVAEPPSET